MAVAVSNILLASLIIFVSGQQRLFNVDPIKKLNYAEEITSLVQGADEIREIGIFHHQLNAYSQNQVDNMLPRLGDGKVICFYKFEEFTYLELRRMPILDLVVFFIDELSLVSKINLFKMTNKKMSF